MDVDWRVDVKTSANTVSRMATPTALVQMQVRAPLPLDLWASLSTPQRKRPQIAKPSVREGVVGDVESVNFEASRETLQTMLDGLGKVREQLSAV